MPLHFPVSKCYIGFQFLGRMKKRMQNLLYFKEYKQIKHEQDETRRSLCETNITLPTLIKTKIKSNFFSIF